MAIADRSQARGRTKVRVLAVHTTEGYGTAQQLHDASWWEGSSHAIIDDNEIVLGVPYERASWTLRSGNNWSDNVELIGWASRSRDNWLRDHAHQLELTAQWLAERSKARGIPLVKLTPEQYAAGASGVIGHRDHTLGYHDGTHLDPGEGFPWDVVLAKARAILTPPLEDDLTPDESKKLSELHAALTQPVIKGLTLAAAVRQLLTQTDEVEPLLRDNAAKHAAPPATAG